MIEVKLGRACLPRKRGPKKKAPIESREACLPFPENLGFEVPGPEIP